MTSLRQRVVEKLADQGLQNALAKALGTVNAKREVALAELVDAPGVKSAAGAMKRDAVGRLWELLEAFEQVLTTAGTTVLWARDEADVRRYVAEIASAHKVHRTVLSKTMVGEELGLEQALKDAGSSVVQTDVGERVVQLAQQRPSHITAPCLHLRAEDVGRILSTKANLPYSDDPEQLSRSIARSLRPHFLAAQMGVSGANVLVAKTGNIVCVENEGNVRMSITVPPVHVVVTGVEKVVPTLDDARLVLALLPRMATGQRATCYTSILEPTPLPGQHRYVILVDNGRSALFGAGPFRDLLRCIRCGACMNVCPVYQRVGGHAYNGTYPGPIGIAMAGGNGTSDTVDGLQLCTLCGACSEVCPVEIPLDRLILLGRAQARPHRSARDVRQERRALSWYRRAMSGRARYRLSDWAHRLGVAWFPGTVARVEGNLGWREERRAPKPAGRLFRSWWHSRRKRGD